MRQPGDEPDRVREGDSREPDIGALFREGVAIDRALRRAAREAFRTHKRHGVPIVVWENGKVVLIPPDQIPTDE